MRKTLSSPEASKVLHNTLTAIDKNVDTPGKMQVDHESELFRLPKNFDPAVGLDNATTANLLVAWLKLQGVSLVFDDQVVRQALDKAVTRLETLIPPG